MHVKTIVLAAALSASGLLHAQFDFKLAGRDVQVHSFASQGYEYASANHYLTMRNGGSFAMTDGGATISSQITDRFRVGAQAYVRSIGELGKGTVQLDWATGDYKFKDWFGVRGGKVKTVLGLYNDTQDMAFLHTWALLPQSTYSLDMRGVTLAHIGGDAYGSVSLKRLGSLSYTAYVGHRPSDPTGGYYYGLQEGAGVRLNFMSGRVAGGDLHWTAPLKGLVVGASLMDLDISADGVKERSTPAAPGIVGSHHRVDTKKDDIYAYYATYSIGNLKIDGEYRRQWKVALPVGGSIVPGGNPVDSRSWYTSAAYRISKRLEVGAYHSRFYRDWAALHSANTNHIFDQALTARIDLTRFWNVKVEGHFMDGNGGNGTFRGFYPGIFSDVVAKTNVLVLRTGWNF